MRIGRQRDGHASLVSLGQQVWVRIQLAVALVEPCARDLEAHAIKRTGDGWPVPGNLLPVHLHEVRMAERVEETALSRTRQQLVVTAPSLLGADAPDQARFRVDALVADEVDRADQVVPGVRRQDLPRLLLFARHVVDLEPKLDGQALPLGLGNRVDIGLERVVTALEVVLHRPQ
jgi:hypothetical protein